MASRHLVRKFNELFGSWLVGLGFRKGEDYEYVRATDQVEQIIAFSPRCLGLNRPHGFNVFVAVRLLCLEAKLKTDCPEKYVPVVALPMHLLKEGWEFTEWPLGDPSATAEVIRRLESHGIAFLERYSDPAEVKTRLEPETADWFIFGPEARIRLLAVILFAEGDRQGALDLIDEALKTRRNKRPALWWDLEQLRRLLESQGS